MAFDSANVRATEKISKYLQLPFSNQLINQDPPQQLQQEIDVIATFGSNPYTNLEVDSLGTKWNELLQLIPQRDQLLQVKMRVSELIILHSMLAKFLILPM